MAIALAQVVLENISGFPTDRSVMTFHFATPFPSVTPEDASSITARLKTFYNSVLPPGATPLANLISPVVARSLSRIKVYDLTGPPPRPPVLDDPWVLGSTSGTPFPNEVALVLSYKAAPTPGISPRRSRGRMYLGPLAYGNSVVTSGDLRPAQGDINKLIGAGAWLIPPFGTTTQIQWVVYSPTQRAQGAPQSGYALPVVRVSVDDAYDTQRRRGRVATTRTALP